jgi:hypothetical protein
VGERLEGFIYGTLIVLGMIILGAKAYPDRPGRIAAFVVVTSVIFWLAHVYAHGMGRSVSQGRALDACAVTADRPARGRDRGSRAAAPSCLCSSPRSV